MFRSVLSLIIAFGLLVAALAGGNSPRTRAGAAVDGATSAPRVRISASPVPPRSSVTAPPIDGISCEGREVPTFHIHAHLELIVRGRKAVVPAGIGAVSGDDGSLACLYWLHTHDETGIIHVEAPGGDYTLGQFFDIWGQPLTAHRVASHDGDVRAFVNGDAYVGSVRAIPLRAHEAIVLEVGEPLIPPSPFAFPTGT